MTRRQNDSHHDDAPQPSGQSSVNETADGATNGVNEVPPTLEALQGQLEEERNRANGYFAQWQRAAADFQNFKRRTEHEREEQALYANKAIITNLLPAVDDLDRALAHVDAAIEASPWIEGVRQIQRKLKGALEASGVSEIRAAGEPFDPNIHEAISEGPGEHGKVINEVQRGYKLGSRVLRPAIVIVGDGSTASST